MYQLLKTFSQTTWIRHVSCLNFPELQVTTKKKSILSTNPVAKIIPVLQIWLQLLTKLCWTSGIFANASTVWLVPRWKFGLANRLCPSTASILPNFSISTTSSSWHLDYFGLILHSLRNSWSWYSRVILGITFGHTWRREQNKKSVGLYVKYSQTLCVWICVHMHTHIHAIDLPRWS